MKDDRPSAMLGRYGTAILAGMQRPSWAERISGRRTPVYGGTVAHVEKQRRRARNRQARASRRTNRR